MANQMVREETKAKRTNKSVIGPNGKANTRRMTNPKSAKRIKVSK